MGSMAWKPGVGIVDGSFFLLVVELEGPTQVDCLLGCLLFVGLIDGWLQRAPRVKITVLQVQGLLMQEHHTSPRSGLASPDAC